MYLIGVNPDIQYDHAAYTPGVLGAAANGYIYQFVRASAALIMNRVAVIHANGDASHVSQSNHDEGPLGVATQAFAAGVYGWLMVKGFHDVSHSAAVNAANQPSVSTTAGRLDDANTHNLVGLRFSVSGTGSGAVRSFINFPSARGA